MAEVERKEHPIVRKFSGVVASLGEGNADFDVMAKFERALETTKAVAIRTGKPQKGKLKLTIRMVVDENGTASLFYDCDTVEPKLPTKSSLGFVTREGKFTFTQPTEQTSLDFSRPRVVEGGASAPKDVGGNEQPAKEAAQNA